MTDRARHSIGLLALAGFLVFAGGCPRASREDQNPPTPAPPVEGPVVTSPDMGTPPGLEDDEEGGRRMRRILTQVRRNYINGIEGLSPASALSVIDRDRFYDYPRFEEELTQFLRSLGEMRLFVREVDVQLTGDRAVMIVDAQMVFASRLDPSRRGERRSQITFHFRRTERGWRIIEIQPRRFFLP